MPADEERPFHGPPRPDGGLLHAAAGQLHGDVRGPPPTRPCALRVGEAGRRRRVREHLQPDLARDDRGHTPLGRDQPRSRVPAVVADVGRRHRSARSACSRSCTETSPARTSRRSSSSPIARSCSNGSPTGNRSSSSARTSSSKTSASTWAISPAPRTGRASTGSTPERHLLIGRLLGYLEVMGLNVIDDILRKAANVLKTFPVSGGEAVNEGDITNEELNRRVKAFRKRQNARTRAEFMNLMTSDHGHIVIEAGSGSRDAKDANGSVVMEPFAAGTREDLYLAARVPARRSIRSSATTATARHPASSSSVPEIRHLDSPNHAHTIGETIAEHRQPRPWRRLATTPRRAPLPDPDPVRELRDVSRAWRRASRPAGDREVTVRCQTTVAMCIRRGCGMPEFARYSPGVYDAYAEVELAAEIHDRTRAAGTGLVRVARHQWARARTFARTGRPARIA